jgi:hypothetical protein
MVLTKKKGTSPIFFELINFFIQIHFYNIFYTNTTTFL